MGVKQFWTAFEHHTKISELSKCVIEAFQESGMRRCRIGIDANIWIYLCNSTATNSNGCWSDRNPLGTFLDKLIRLAKQPVDLVFVFDGDAKPEIKRGIRVVNRRHSMYEGMIALIEAFGYHHHTAPAEGEAELAAMYKARLIDVILTDDSDVFLFGGTTILRNWNMKTDREFVRWMSPTTDESPTADQYILYGLLVGNDFDNRVGLRNCGPQLAKELMLAGSMAEHLCHSARSLTSSEFDVFLVQWRQDLRHLLRRNPHHSLSSRHPILADAIPDNFPDPAIVKLYTNPLVTSPEALEYLDLTCRAPDILSITQQCQRQFDWANPGQLVERFESTILPSLLMRAFTDVIASADREYRRSHQAPSTITIHHELFPSTTFTIGTERKLRGIKQVELSGPVTHLRRQILASLKSVLGDEVPAFDISGPFTTCVPTLLVTTLLGSDNLTRSPPEPPDDLIGSIRTAFLMTGEIDVETLAWLTRSTIESRGISSHTVLDVVEVLIDAIRTAPAQPQAAALSMEPSDDLWIRYVHLFRALSGSISREYTLDPVVRVIESQLRDHRHQYDPATAGRLSNILHLARSSTSPPVKTSNRENQMSGFGAFCLAEGVAESELMELA